MKRCFIFAAGTFYGLRKRPEAGDLVIAADAGYRVCQQEGLVPDVILGDFDSMEAPDAGEKVCRLPVEKVFIGKLIILTTGNTKLYIPRKINS